MAADDQLDAQQLRAELARNKHEMLQGQAEQLALQLEEVQSDLAEAIAAAVPILEDPQETVTDFTDQYIDLFEEAEDANEWWEDVLIPIRNFTGSMSKSLTGIDFIERAEDSFSMIKSLATGDFEGAAQTYGKMQRENWNSPIVQNAIKAGIKKKTGVELNDEQMAIIKESGDDAIVSIFPQDTAQIRQDLLDTFLTDEFGELAERNALANDLLSTAFAERSLGNGISFALVDAELTAFAQQFGLDSANTAVIDGMVTTLRGVAQTSLEEILGGQTPTISTTISDAIAGLPSGSQIVEVTDTIENKIYNDFISSNTDSNKALGAIIATQADLMEPLEMGFSALTGWDSTKAGMFSEAWDDFINERAVELSLDNFDFDLSPQELFALLPTEVHEGLNEAEKEIRKAIGHSEYINNQSSHEERMKANAEQAADGNDEEMDAAEADRNAHIMEFQANMIGMGEAINNAVEQVSLVQNELVKIKVGGPRRGCLGDYRGKTGWSGE